MKKLLIGLTLVMVVGVVTIPRLRAATALYNSTVRIVDSAGNVLGGAASAVTASYNSTVQVVDSTGHVLDQLVNLAAPSAIGQQNVLTYGAKGDGVTDDGPAIRNAVAAVPPGGSLFFPAGKTYLIHTGVTVSGTNCGMTFPVSGMTVYAYGATIKTDLTNGIQVVCVSPNTAQIPQNAWETVPTQYSISSGATRGSNAVTLTTHSQASNFTIGDIVYLKGATGFNNTGVNTVQAANSGTGIITLGQPLGKTYTGSPIISDVQSLTVTDLTWFGGIINVPSGDYALTTSTARRVKLQDVTLVTGDQAGQDVYSNNDAFDIELNNVWMLSACGGVFDMQGRAVANIKVKGGGGVLNGPCSGTVSVVMGNVAESAEIVKFDGTQLTDNTGFGQLAFGASAYDTTFNNGTFRTIGNTSTNVPMIDTTGSTDSRITSSTIEHDSGQFTTIKLGGTDDIFSNNHVNDFSTTNSDTIIVSTGPSVLNGNDILSSATGVGGLELGTPDVSFTNNTIRNPSATNARCVTVDDPGSVSALKLVIAGNKLLNCTTQIQYQGSATTNVPHRVVQGNDGVADFRADAAQIGYGLTSLGGGSAPTLGTIGGSGPATAGQNSWMLLKDSSGNSFWVPVWK